MTMIDKAEALLPCPFCGSTMQVAMRDAMLCLECYAAGPQDEDRKTAWNRRALPARGVGVDAVAVKNAVMGWVWAEDSDVSKRLGPKHTDALIARIFAALEPAPTDAAQVREERLRGALEWYAKDGWNDRSLEPPTPEEVEVFGDNILDFPMPEIFFDRGERARTALSATAPTDAAQAREAALEWVKKHGIHAEDCDTVTRQDDFDLDFNMETICTCGLTAILAMIGEAP